MPEEKKPKVKPKLMSKKAAQESAKKDAAYKGKQGKQTLKNAKVNMPAQKKSAPKKSDKKKTGKKKDSTPLPGAIVTLDAQQLQILQNDAGIIIPRIEDNLRQWKTDWTKIEQDAMEVRDRELWKFTDTPWKNWEAYKKDMGKILGIGKTTLYNLLTTAEATPNTSPEKRRAMGKRKGKVAADIINAEKKKGHDVPPEKEAEIVDAAISKSQPEFEQAMEEKGLKVESGKKKKNGNGPKLDPLLFNPSAGTHPERAKDGGSAYVEGKTGTASQYTSIVQQGIDIYLFVYEPDCSPETALHGVCGHFTNASCTVKGLEKFTNLEAFEYLKEQDRQRAAGA